MRTTDRIIFACLVLACTFFIAGCVDHVANRDIVVVKITPNGSMDWSRVIDMGWNSAAHGILETADKNLVILAVVPGVPNPKPTDKNYDALIKISNKNEFLWNLTLNDKKCGDDAIFQDPNGDLVTGSGGNICRINTNGEIIWSGSMMWNRSRDTVSHISQILPTEDGGYFVAGQRMDNVLPGNTVQYNDDGSLSLQPVSAEEQNRSGSLYHPVFQTMVAKIGADGKTIWQHSLVKAGFTDAPANIFSVKNDRVYVLVIGRQLVRLDEEGNFLNSTQFYEIPEAGKSTLEQQDLRQFIVNSQEGIFINDHGMPVGIQDLPQFGTKFAATKEQGYFLAGFKDSGSYTDSISRKAKSEGLYISKVTSDGKPVWETTVPNVSMNIVKQVIQTSDGGFAIVGENDKGWN